MLSGVLSEGKFTIREWRNKIDQYPVAWEYNIRGAVELQCVPSSQLSTPYEIC